VITSAGRCERGKRDWAKTPTMAGTTCQTSTYRSLMAPSPVLSAWRGPTTEGSSATGLHVSGEQMLQHLVFPEKPITLQVSTRSGMA